MSEQDVAGHKLDVLRPALDAGEASPVATDFSLERVLSRLRDVPREGKPASKTIAIDGTTFVVRHISCWRTSAAGNTIVWSVGDSEGVQLSGDHSEALTAAVEAL